MIQKLTLRNFRNFSHKEISFCEWKNIIIGENGKGKSNILEALCLASNNSIAESTPHFLLQKQCDFFHIHYTLSHGNISLYYDGETKRKKLSLENKATTQKKIDQSLPHIVSFHPMKMNLMYLGPSSRRDFLDEILIKTFPEYKKILQGYNTVLRNRNKILKNIAAGKSQLSELDFWNQKYLSGAELVYKHRNQIVEYFQKHIHTLEKYFFGKVSEISFSYISKTPALSESLPYLKNYIQENTQKEILLWKTLRGPHLDDFDIIVDGVPLVHYASRGEVKSSILWLMFLETDFIEHFWEKKNTIFLLDDILSELDAKHRDKLWDYIWDRQCIVTSIEDFEVDSYKIFL